MTVDPADVAEMAHFVLEEKDAKKRLAEAEEAIELWTKRVTMARKHGQESLALEADERLAQEKAKQEEALHDLERIANDKHMLRYETRLPGENPGQAFAEQLLGQFEDMGVDAKEYELNKLSKDQEADDMLAALKMKLGNKP